MNEIIPRDIWDIVCNLPLAGDGFPDLADLDAIARAIMGERERCAQIVDEFYDHVPDQLRDAQDVHLVEAQRLIARAIRAPSV